MVNSSVERALRCAAGVVSERRQIAGLDRVEEVVDDVFGVRGDVQRRAVPAVRDLRLEERLLEQFDVGRRPLVEPELGRRHVGREPDGERAELALELVEQLVDGVFDLLGDDQFVTLPGVRVTGVGERRRQLGALVDRPRRHVVQHVHGVGVVRIPVDRRRAGRDCTRLVLVLAVGSAHEGHAQTLPAGSDQPARPARLDQRERARRPISASGHEVADQPVLGELVLDGAKAVALAVHHVELDVAAGGSDALDEPQALLDRHDGVGVAVQHEERRGDAVGVRERRAFAVEIDVDRAGRRATTV